jgi:hypothetical protein
MLMQAKSQRFGETQTRHVHRWTMTSPHGITTQKTVIIMCQIIHKLILMKDADYQPPYDSHISPIIID